MVAIHKPAHDIILKPVVSEKSYALSDRGQYTFVVAPNANKVQIKQAIEEIFNVKVTNVNTLNRAGKRQRTRNGFGQRVNQKRAIVTGAEGGFAAEEAEMAARAGAKTVGLGPRILRCETAPLAVLSAVMTLTGNLE